jgi:hypothetical protein
MNKRNVLLSAVALSTLVFGSCQRTPYAAFNKPTTQPIERAQTVSAAPEQATPAAAASAPTLTEAMAPAPAAASAPVEATASVKKTTSAPKFMNRKAEALMAKTQFVKNEHGTVTFQAQEGQKLTGLEKMVVKKVNKQIKKADAKGGAFSDLNKTLRIGLILLGVAIVLSIVGGIAGFGYGYAGGLALLISLVWLAGVVLSIYGLGLQLDWW